MSLSVASNEPSKNMQVQIDANVRERYLEKMKV